MNANSSKRAEAEGEITGSTTGDPLASLGGGEVAAVVVTAITTITGGSIGFSYCCCYGTTTDITEPHV